MKVHFLLIASTLFLYSCAGVGSIRDRNPDYTVNFKGTPESMASCVINTWFNDESRSPVKSSYNNLIHVTDVAGASVFWDLTLRPDGVAEVRGHPTVWGWAMGENVIPVINQCDTGMINK
jgi:hypothetical protein